MSLDELSAEEAQREFRDLVESQQARALWFMKQPIPTDLAGTQAPEILRHIAEKGTRDVWLRTRRLQRWRSPRLEETDI